MGKKELWFGLMAAIFVAFFLSRFASQCPDGLEKVMGIKSEKSIGPLAGLAGTLVVFGLGYSLALLLKRYRRQ